MSIYSLSEALKNLDKSSRLGIDIPPELRQTLDSAKQAINAFLQASQEDSDSRERDSSLEQMLLFLWTSFFNNVIQKNDDFYRENFELYNTMLFNEKDYGKTVVAIDIREKIRAIHEMLKSWPHMVPPRIEDINFPESFLKNNMIYESPSERGIERMEPKYGFVEPPSLKPDVRPISIQDYLATEYKIEDDCFNDQKVVDIANFMRDPENSSYDPLKFDPTFLLDVVKKHGSKGYRDVYQMFPHWLSDYHPRE